MLLYLYFFIGHLIGDFLFQTSKIVKWKYSSPKGVALHVFLVFIATSLLFIPYWNSQLIWIALAVNAIIHFFIDLLKVRYELSYKPKNPLPGFWVDQIAHILTFVGIVALLPNTIEPRYFTDTWWFEYYEKENILLYIGGFLLFSYFMDILYFMHQLKGGDHTPYQRSYYSMIVHTFVFAIIFTITWIFGKFYFNVF